MERFDPALGVDEASRRALPQTPQRLKLAQGEPVWVNRRQFGLLPRQRKRRAAKVQGLQIAAHGLDSAPEHIGRRARPGEDLEHREGADRHQQERGPVFGQGLRGLQGFGVGIKQLYEAETRLVARGRQ
jgi:hypothetical protein